MDAIIQPEAPAVRRLKLLTRKQAAELMAVSTDTIDRLLAKGDLDSVRVGVKSIRVKLASIRRYLGA
jgi:excisionase family DNA binding protein